MKINFPDTSTKGPWMSPTDGWFNVLPLPPCSLQYTCSGFMELNDRPLITKPDSVCHKVQTEVLQYYKDSFEVPLPIELFQEIPERSPWVPPCNPSWSLVVPALRFLLRRLLKCISKFVGAKMILFFRGFRVGRNSKALCESCTKSCSAGLGSISLRDTQRSAGSKCY